MALEVFAKVGDVVGDSTDARHVGWIDVLSFDWGVEVASGSSSGSGAGSGRPDPRDLVLTAATSSASPRLFLACATGRRFPQAEVHVRRSGDRGVFLTLLITEVSIPKFELGASAGTSGPVDQFALAFRRFTMSYARQRPDGTLDTPVTAGFDFVSNSPL